MLFYYIPLSIYFNRIGSRERVRRQRSDFLIYVFMSTLTSKPEVIVLFGGVAKFKVERGGGCIEGERVWRERGRGKGQVVRYDNYMRTLPPKTVVMTSYTTIICSYWIFS